MFFFSSRRRHTRCSRDWSSDVCSSDLEALEVAERYRGPIHLLLTDVMMPRMNGLQLTGPFAAVRAHARVLYMTGYAEMPPVPDGALVQKPFTVFTLMDAVRRTLERPERTEHLVSPD